MTVTTPAWQDVLLGVIFVVGGCVAAAAAVTTARRSRNWLYLVCAIGAAAVVAGVAGQRAWPRDDNPRLTPEQASTLRPGPWDAGVYLPVINLTAAPVAVGGFLFGLVGLSLVLFFEAIPEAGPRQRAPLPALEEQDSV